ncbi:hypothetical protein DY000_02041238 [Brassica cretica]|uniref:Uncharacterized protein n=1 Tax=Brassica cretica TaxID=69181 RepID=A0ABQ7BJ71_BRACR|nr:hypothetical protein DY000_02041238 [Brassica cretica]
MRSVWSLRSDRALPKRRYDTNPCILVYPSMLSPEDHSEPISFGVNTSNIFGSPSMPISGYESLAQPLPRRYQTSHKLLMYQKQLPLLQPDSLSLKLQQFSEPTSDAHFFGFRYSNCFRTVGNYSIKLALHLLTYIIY